MRSTSSTAREDQCSFEDSSTKLLGIVWRPAADTFTFKSQQTGLITKLTKRQILSETAQFYDPLGFLSPVIIRAKVLLQELWLEKLSWDDQVSPQTVSRWTTLRKELEGVTTISIPRWLHTTTTSTAELHGFSDASQLAMSAEVSIKITDSEGASNVTLVCTKTKVAPLKKLSIPRLELSAALLLSKLIRYAQQTLELNNSPVYLWTDSSVTLTWIQSHSSRWKEFVRNRVSAIQDLTANCVWKFVPGKENPADCASRGLSVSQLQRHHLWWTGPPWLIRDQVHWPEQTAQTDSTYHHSEERPGLLLAVASREQEYHWDIINRYSSLTRLLRITAICFRVSQLIQKQPHAKLCDPLTPQDLERSKVFWIQATQAAFFSSELKFIRSNTLPPTHPFHRLTAYIDTQGIIRVGGRLENSSLSEEAIHPAILPKDCFFSTLVIRDAHEKTFHGGNQSTLNYIKQSYWILGGRIPIRSFILRGVKCARQRGVRAQQLMGQLPSTRVTPSRPFSVSRVDYAGPLSIKSWKGRGAKTYKGWLCILYALSRQHYTWRLFVSRRGICHTLHSDCGTNFKGADASLQKLFTQETLEATQLGCSLTNSGTTWKFNPPAAPHMRGKWEAAVKSVKYHLNRTVSDTLLTYEELTTLLTQIEAVLDSRPLEPSTEDPDDLSVLTPAHFLVGSTLHSVPEPSLMDINQSRLSRWQLIQQKFQYFWSKWSTQYLQRQLAVSKWFHPSHKIQVGSLVLLTDERFPPSKWPLARVTQLHPGKDGLTRVVTLKTATRSIIRPIAKLAILPVYSNQEDSIHHQDS